MLGDLDVFLEVFVLIYFLVGVIELFCDLGFEEVDVVVLFDICFFFCGGCCCFMCWNEFFIIVILCFFWLVSFVRIFGLLREFWWVGVWFWFGGLLCDDFDWEVVLLLLFFGWFLLVVWLFVVCFVLVGEIVWFLDLCFFFDLVIVCVCLVFFLR